MKRDKKSLLKIEKEDDGETKLSVIQRLNLQNKALDKILEEMNKTDNKNKDKKSPSDEKG